MPETASANSTPTTADPASDAAKADATPNSQQPTNKKESSSKKKKGLKKLIPF
jgi:hypothetical protein